VLCLHREDASKGFDAREIDLIRRVSPHVAEGLRRAVTSGPVAAIGAEDAFPGMIVLDANLAMVSMSQEAERWLAEIGEADWPNVSELPIPVYAAARLVRLEDGPATAPASGSTPITGRRRRAAGALISRRGR